MHTPAGLRCVAAFIVFCGAAALAQDGALAVPEVFRGTWKVVWQAKTKELNSKLVLTEAGGSWQTYHVTSQSDACQGRQVAVAVAAAASDAVTLKLKFSDVMAGCNDVTLKLRRGDDGAVTGTRSNHAVTLTRQ